MQGQDIKQARQALGLTQAQFSDKLGIGDRHLRRLERGQRNASESVLKLINLMMEGKI